MADRDPASSESVSTYLIERLLADGHLSREGYERARSLVWPPDRMLRWFEWGLLSAGVTLVLVGLGYWFAYNWTAIPRLGKLGLVEVVFVASVATAAVRGLDDSLGTLALVGATISVGGFLIVLGQAYPSGSPIWRLFGGWAVLSVGFVALARSQLLWVFWLALVDGAAAFYWLETAPEPSQAGFTFAAAAIGLYTLVAAGFGEVIRELVAPEWMEARWSRWVLLAVGFLFLSIPVWAYVGLGWSPPSWLPFATFVVWAATLLGSYLYFRRVRFDLVVLTMVGVVAASTPMIRMFVAVTRHTSIEIAMLATGVGLLVGTAVLVYWLTGLDDAAVDESGREAEGEARP